MAPRTDSGTEIYIRLSSVINWDFVDIAKTPFWLILRASSLKLKAKNVKIIHLEVIIFTEPLWQGSNFGPSWLIQPAISLLIRIKNIFRQASRELNRKNNFDPDQKWNGSPKASSDYKCYLLSTGPKNGPLYFTEIHNFFHFCGQQCKKQVTSYGFCLL